MKKYFLVKSLMWRTSFFKDFFSLGTKLKNKKIYFLPSLVCDPTSTNSLNSPLSLSNDMPFELLCRRTRPGCLGGNPDGVEGNWPWIEDVPAGFWLLRLFTVAASMILLSSVSWSWLVNLTKDSSFTWSKVVHYNGGSGETIRVSLNHTWRC